ncbi:hypothetical protein IGB42_02075 [Andreprevotia sp. IGB-42]|uniref:right-handed parallel beta-helix repeat-containing protein n=1 Tax=Andreprevotia sp. IGB-42 TaxID=2497473 RepID=UPI0013578B01|nr:right-handed parallel beta-helix repeat-containing protein [Andreprevotia sp. IGB-42]KAF0813722.1 hypothetical protein IGB42_02075 [Andreprevotia sp. IGB-42]
MSAVDLSRNATDFFKRYNGVRMQQGRVLTDDDFNEAAQLDLEDQRRTRLDTIGAYGTPDNGFLLKNPQVVNGKPTFTLAAGSLYLGGLRLEQPVDEPFHLQKDWLFFDRAADWPSAPTSGSRIDLVWIEAWQQPVTAVEDGELFEVALGGPDTSARLRTMRRVYVQTGVNTEECPEAWDALKNSWSALGTLAADYELASTAKLQVSFTVPSETTNLCAPPQNGGYLGAENQAIRVQMVDATHYTWGYDNAAPLYRALLTTSNNKRVKLKLLTEPKDAVHWPLHDQVVEILPWSAALPNGERVAELAGHLTKVASSYNPDSAEFTIVDEPPTGFENRWEGRDDQASFFNGQPEQRYVYVRIWNRGDDLASPAKVPLANNVLGHTGLSITFLGGPLRAYDYWIIAARPAAPNVVTPWVLKSGAAAHGLKRYRAPLGLIRWTADGSGVTGLVIHDCRRPFLPLTKIRNCCGVTVGDGTNSFGQFTSINAAIAALPATGGSVCILPGTYEETVYVIGRKHITLHGCGPRSRIVAPVKDKNNELPAIYVQESQDITIEGLALEAGYLPALLVWESEQVTLTDSLVEMRDQASPYAAVYLQGEDLAVTHSVITVLDGKQEETALAGGSTFAGSSAHGGIQIAGGSDGVRIADNRIVGGFGHGITLGSLVQYTKDGEEKDVPDQEPTDDDPCDACAPLSIFFLTTEDDKVFYRSRGDLYRIEITDNDILGHGSNGISVLRLFGIVEKTIELIGVHGLLIANNRIAYNLWRQIAPIPAQFRLFVTYGGVVLAQVSDLVIEHNLITRHGITRGSPASGVYAMLVQGVRIEHNQIIDNGPADKEPVSSAQPGLRAGVHIWIALPAHAASKQKRADALLHRKATAQGSEQLRIHDNVISQPLGQALFILAAGPLAITDNRLSSQGTTSTGLQLLASTVVAADIGISREWSIGLLITLVLQIFSKSSPGGSHYGSKICDISRLAMFTKAFKPALPTGKLLFSDNQVSYDSLADEDDPQGFAISSALLFSLDDVAAISNQFEFGAQQQLAFIDLLAFGVSIRVNDNRLTETWGRSFLSGYTLGLMNTTTDNQSTHCLAGNGFLESIHDNLALAEAFCEGACSKQGAKALAAFLGAGALAVKS